MPGAARKEYTSAKRGRKKENFGELALRCFAFASRSFVEQLRDAHQVVGQHGRTDENFKPLGSFGQAPLHPSAAEEDRDGAFDARAKALPFFEVRTLLIGGAPGGFLPAALREANFFDPRAFTGLLVPLTVESAVATVELGSVSEVFLVVFQRRFDVLFVGRIPFEHFIFGNQSSRTFGQEYFVTKLDGRLYLAALDQVGMDFKDRKDLLLVGNLFSLEHAAAGLIDHTVTQFAEPLDLLAEREDAQAAELALTSLPTPSSPADLETHNRALLLALESRTAYHLLQQVLERSCGAICVPPN